MASALQLDRRFRWCLYAAVAVLFVTGAAWLAADQLKETPSGEFWQAATANLLMVHGGAAIITLLLLGGLFSSHIARTWRTRLNRVSGIVMVFCNAVLIVTAFGLYYLGSENVRPLISDMHIVVGLALPFLLALHIWLGRRRVRNGLVPRSAKPPPPLA
jgi:hypothetical protein